MERGEEYFARTLRLKPVIEADSDLIGRVAEAFEATYDNRMSPYVPVIVPDGLVDLGSGKDHVVIGLGRTIIDPADGTEIPLAIKLRLRRPYEGDNDFDLEEQVGAYNAAFESGSNPPYFVGVVTAEASYDGRPRKRLAGILTEDVSRGKTLRLIERPDDDFCERVLPDGSTERIFLDPGFGAYSSDGEKYLTPEARIDIE
jgi:hypothetical protein